MSELIKVLVTGGAGFIGSALCRHLHSKGNFHIVILDKLTYASNLNSIKNIINDDIVTFIKGSIGDKKLIKEIFDKYSPRFIFNLAAETHVDNSIENPEIFVKTNIIETFSLLEESLKYYTSLCDIDKSLFRFLQVSTDEVYGDIEASIKPVSEKSPYRPSSPYSATKAAGDHLVKSYFRTFNLPTFVSNCSNNYGPFQNQEKFIPVIVSSVLNGKKIPVYGNGEQSREWLFVDDHCDALLTIAKQGKVGESYNIGSGNELSNIELIKLILSELKKQSLISSEDLSQHVNFVSDRLGHDKRYAIDSSKLQMNFNWKAKVSFAKGIKETIQSILK